MTSLRKYFQPRLLIILLLGFSSGLPLALTGSLLTAMLKESSIDITTIGIFAVVGNPYSLKFLWAPFMDAFPFPFLSKRFGRRRGWMLATQMALMIAIAGLACSDPASNPLGTALWALLVAFCSASQDIVVDAYRVEILEKEQYGLGAAMVQYGYRIGMLVSGAGALALSDYISWTATYLVMAACMLVGGITVLFSPEPAAAEDTGPDDAAMKTRSQQFRFWVERVIVAPFRDFMTRPRWLAILVFIVLYKMGDAFLGFLTTPFYLEVGFSKTEIASVAKLFGFGATLLGLFLGGVMIYKAGMLRTLWVCGILSAVTNLLFVWLSRAGADLSVLAVVISMENISGGMTSVAFVAFLSSLCNTRFTATQYALLSSLAALGRTNLSTATGFVVKSVGWEGFFIVSALLAIPGLALLWWLRKEIK